MLAWGVKRWLNFHYKTTKQTNIFEDYRAPVGTALRNPLTKEKYDYVPNVYAREEVWEKRRAVSHSSSFSAALPNH